MIRKARPKDLTSIKNLTEACAEKLQEKGIFQWNENYPSLERFRKDIDLQELYVLEENGRLQGIMALTPQMDEEYIPIKWLTLNANNLYLHRLATNPESWGAGYGRKLMDFAENFAQDNGFVSVRLDTFSQNLRNQNFYETRGYQKLGDVYFPQQSEHPFYCYELLL